MSRKNKPFYYGEESLSAGLALEIARGSRKGVIGNNAAEHINAGREAVKAVVQKGETVYGKTGSAEFGPGPPYDTHAWFTGWWDGLAFAFVVEGGGSGGEVAAPLAARFVEALLELG